MFQLVYCKSATPVKMQLHGISRRATFWNISLNVIDFFKRVAGNKNFFCHFIRDWLHDR